MRHKKKNRLSAVELVSVLIGTAVIFVKAAGLAAVERGYFAVGGEFMLLLLPIIYYAAKQIARDFVSDIAGIYRNADED